MKLHSAINKESIVTGISLPDKKAALKKVAQTAALSKALENIPVEDIYKALQVREELGSTGFGQGIAIPHCRIAGATQFVVGLINIEGGVDFDSADGEKVKLIVFIVGPENESNEHIALLSEISHTLLLPGTYEEMIAARDPEVLMECFLRHSKDNLDAKDHASKNLFHVFIQDETMFRDVLQVFAAMEPTAISIVEAKNAGEYLGKLPLFAGFWTDRQMDVCHTITALVEKKYANEIIRRIEQITGKLDESSNAVVSIQDVFYAAGSLSS